MTTYRWDVDWGPSRADLVAIAEEHERAGRVRYRKSGALDQRFTVSRFVQRVRDGADGYIRLPPQSPEAS